MSVEIMFDSVFHVEPLDEFLYNALDDSLTDVEKVVVGWDAVDQTKGIAWTGQQSRCLWRDDGRRITISLADQRGYCVRVSIHPDPMFAQNEAA